MALGRAVSAAMSLVRKVVFLPSAGEVRVIRSVLSALTMPESSRPSFSFTKRLPKPGTMEALGSTIDSRMAMRWARCESAVRSGPISPPSLPTRWQRMQPASGFSRKISRPSFASPPSRHSRHCRSGSVEADSTRARSARRARRAGSWRLPAASSTSSQSARGRRPASSSSNRRAISRSASDPGSAASRRSVRCCARISFRLGSWSSPSAPAPNNSKMTRSAFIPCGPWIRQPPEHRRIELVLGDLDARVQRFGGVAGQDGDAALVDDVAGVHAGIDVVDGAAGFRDAGGERLRPRLEAGEGGQERRVDVDDAAREGLEQRRLDHAHVAGEHDPLDAGFV